MDLIKKAKTGALWSVFGQILLKILSFGSVLILNRLLTPEEFGLVAIANVTFAILKLFGNLGIASGIVYRQENFDDYVNSAFWLNIGIGILLMFVSLGTAPFLADFYRDETLKSILYYLSFGFLFKSLETVHNSLLTKELKFEILTKIEVVTEIISTITVIILAYLEFGVWSLVIPMVIFSPVKILIYWKTEKWRPKIKINYTLCKDVYDYGKHSFLSEMLGYLIANIDYLITGRFLGKKELGIYQFSYNWANWPIANVVWVLSKVAFPTFSKLKNDTEELKRVYFKMTKIIALFTSVFYAILLAQTELFVLIIGGNQWTEAINPLRIIIIYGFIRSLGSHGGRVFLALGEPSVLSKFGLITFPCVAIGVLIGVNFGIVGVSVATAIVSGFFGLLFIWFVLRKLEESILSFLALIKSSLISAVLSILAMLLTQNFLENQNLNILIEFSFISLTGTGIYVGSLFLLFRKDFQEVFELIKSFKS
ncbi:lipopolysaccharide biosynthesis protein [bacterium]|nr:lipopolysaccharide biosynthesis protein [bacterium]